MWILLATALAQPVPDALPPLPPPDRSRLNSYHSDPLFLPHLDLSVLGGVNNSGEPTGIVLAEVRFGNTFAVGVGATPQALAHGPVLTWNWRAFSLQHIWNLDFLLRTPVLDFSAVQIGIGGDISPVHDGRFAIRLRGLAGTAGLSAELGVVVRAF
ncbi:MAG: hypothetical protein KC912_01780 [Proteobacteria bacterium]|nr:hypothetical protein [Pseudomonadota bacterium]